jgi:transcriptional regulator with XRE-family HTH domain
MQNSSSVFTQRFQRLFSDGKWTQMGLAEASKVSQSLIARYLKGDGVPTLDNLDRLARALKVTPESLIGSQEPFTPPKPSALEALEILSELDERDLKIAVMNLQSLPGYLKKMKNHHGAG